ERAGTGSTDREAADAESDPLDQSVDLRDRCQLLRRRPPLGGHDSPDQVTDGDVLDERRRQAVRTGRGEARTELPVVEPAGAVLRAGGRATHVADLPLESGDRARIGVALA